MVSTRPLISNPFSPCTDHLVIVTNATITVFFITVTVMWHNYIRCFFVVNPFNGFFSFRFAVLEAEYNSSSVLQVNLRKPFGSSGSLSANCIFLPKFMPFAFSISSVGTLIVCSFWRQFLFRGLFGSWWSFLLTSIRVCMFCCFFLLASIYFDIQSVME